MVFTVWDAFDGMTGGRCGLLIAERGDAHRMVAYIDTQTMNIGHPAEFRLAESIAERPALLDGEAWLEVLARPPNAEEVNALVDLRDCGRWTDSGKSLRFEPGSHVPGFIYGLLVGPAGCKVEDAVPMTPFCPSLYAAMQKDFQRRPGGGHFIPAAQIKSGESDSQASPVKPGSNRGEQEKEPTAAL